MTLLNREQLLTRSKRRYVEVELPIKGGSVRIQSLTERERSHFERMNTATNGKASAKHLETVRRRLAILCLVDVEGNQLLSDGDIQLLGDCFDSADMEVIVDACAKFCGMAEGDLESLVKNSEGISGDSSS